jgi:hypothetical protein
MSKSTGLPNIVAALRHDRGRKDYEFAAIFKERHAAEPNRGWDLLQSVYDFLFKSGNASEPFGPMWVVDGRRSNAYAQSNRVSGSGVLSRNITGLPQDRW